MKKNHYFQTCLLQTKCRSVKLKCFLFIASVMCVYFIISYMFIEASKSKKHVQNKLELKNVIMHLDLKGAPPKITYLKTLLPKLLSLGVTGLLMEYENMFPFQGQLVNLSAKNHYNIQELQEFVALAVKVGLDVIPLVQTFGHMEHVLKLREFQHLRESPLYPDSICPSRAQSRELIKNMLEQVIKFHEKIYPLKYFHIGADEVFHINKCAKCLKRHRTDTEIYKSHLDTVLEIVKTTSPSTTVLIWDDMFRNIPMQKWKDIKFYNQKVEPVYWEYTPIFQIAHSSMIQYRKKFKNIWIASAFKGADGRTATFPNLRKRFGNHLTWLKSILNYRFRGENDFYNFSGIILTGWSRYSHMEPPCELLPVSIPSLFLNLILLKNFKYIDPKNDGYDTNEIFTKYLHEDFIGNLHCTESTNLEYYNSTNCYFGENQLFNILMDLEIINTDIKTGIKNFESGKSRFESYSKMKYYNLNRLEANIKWCETSITNIKYIKNKLLNNLEYYYDSLFVDEYINYTFYNRINIINKLTKILEEISTI